MKIIYLVLLNVLFMVRGFSQEVPNSETVKPVYTASEIMQIAHSYLDKNKANSLSKYYLSSINFRQATWHQGNRMAGKPTWRLFYMCKELKSFGCHFSLSISNDIKPVVKYSPGR
ncbi:hypothetical protein C2869_03715 [Saccharobesus litoralis]|uniref:Uncharacterized protein n=1 Tax=Saccharobesus litoralis TaxID=2172099 RepID=A0A2S0VN17_9ALTE|nr:hypothetical protein [Saccharobesus litoralis]AWB65596.1 hypothetical protein C2869_03715 [Saccharobesus litoralis]